MVKGGGAGHGAGRFALPDRRPRHRALRLPFPRSAGLHTLPVLRVPHLHRCAQRPAVLAAGWPCGPWHLDLCVLPWALHPVLRSDVLPEGAAIQTEQLRNPAASNHTLRGSFLLLPLSRKWKWRRFIFQNRLWTAAAMGSHNKPIRQALEEVNFSNLLVENGDLW